MLMPLGAYALNYGKEEARIKGRERREREGVAG